MGFCLDTWRISGSNGQKWQNRASGGWTPVPAGCRCEVGAPCHARTARMARFAPATRVPRSFAARACHARSQCTVRKLRGTRAVSRRAEAVRALCALRAFLTPWSTTRAKARPARMARFAPATRVPLSFAARACHALSQCTVRKLRGTRAVSRRAEAVRALCALRAFLTPWSTTRCARLTWRGLRQRAAFLHYHGAGLPCIVSVHSSETERHPFIFTRAIQPGELL